MEAKIANAREKEDKKFAENILVCQNPDCPLSTKKFVKGTGAKYMLYDMEYNFCSETCRVEYIENNHMTSKNETEDHEAKEHYEQQ